MIHILHESQNFKLTSEHHRKQKRGKPMFVITWTSIRGITLAEHDELRDMVDPDRSIGGRTAYHWKFRNLKTARKKYMMLTMRWS